MRLSQIVAPKQPFSLAPYILAVAMGIHAAFAGLALGLQDTMPGLIGMLAAILAHKWAEALTLGISFAKALDDVGRTQSFVLLLIWGLATPGGIILGMVMSDFNGLVKAIFMGISSGTFIYIASAEIIVEEFSVSKHKVAKYFFYLLGFGMMVSVFFIEKALVAE